MAFQMAVEAWLEITLCLVQAGCVSGESNCIGDGVSVNFVELTHQENVHPRVGPGHQHRRLLDIGHDRSRQAL